MRDVTQATSNRKSPPSWTKINASFLGSEADLPAGFHGAFYHLGGHDSCACLWGSAQKDYPAEQNRSVKIETEGSLLRR